MKKTNIQTDREEQQAPEMKVDPHPPTPSLDHILEQQHVITTQEREREI
jgi:hypothetical protein